MSGKSGPLHPDLFQGQLRAGASVHLVAKELGCGAEAVTLGTLLAVGRLQTISSEDVWEMFQREPSG